MEKVVIKAGNKIEMTHIKSAVRSKLSENTYVSSVLDYDGRRHARIAAPIYGGKIIPVQVGDEYGLCFYTSSGLYRSRARIKKRVRDRKTFCLDVELLSRPVKYQRRQFFRLDCVLKMRYRVVSAEEKALRDFIAASEIDDPELLEKYMQKLEGYMDEWERGTLTDISGGGVRFKCSEKLEPDQLVEVSVPLQFGDKTISFYCLSKVVAIADIALKGAHEIELRCEFYEIDKEKQDLVVKYVFHEQRKRMKSKQGAQWADDWDGTERNNSL